MLNTDSKYDSLVKYVISYNVHVNVHVKINSLVFTLYFQIVFQNLKSDVAITMSKQDSVSMYKCICKKTGHFLTVRPTVSQVLQI